MKPIAKKIPKEPANGPKTKVAEEYGLTVGELSSAMTSYLQNEGYDEMGYEYNSLHDWLTIPHRSLNDNAPWQKGDDWNI